MNLLPLLLMTVAKMLPPFVPGVSIYGIGYGTTACLASRSLSLASGAGL